jgi:hypothetical protein
MPMERAEAPEGVRAGAATACLAAGWKPALHGGGGCRWRPQVGNLRYEEGEAVGGARRLPTCGYEEQGRGWQGASAG